MDPQRIAQLKTWLEIDSTSGQEGAYLQRLEADLIAEGWPCRRLPVPGQDPSRFNLLAAKVPQPDVLLCTHVDTVPPFLPVRHEGDWIWARGACDTKGVLLSMFEAAARLEAQNPELAQRVGILMVIGEETDHCGAAAAIDAGLTPSRIILGEPTQCRVAVGQKGILKARLTTTGKAGHSAYPEAGHSAVDKLLEALAKVKQENWPTHPDMGDTLVNIGLIQGGVAANVFAPDASAVLMFRIVTPAAQIEARLRALTEAHGRLEVISQAEPQVMDPPANTDTCVLPFNSDAAWLRQIAPVWLGGPGDIRLAHSVNERISVQDLEQGAELYLQWLRQALDHKEMA